MMKSIYLLSPMIINLVILLIMLMPSKNYKFHPMNLMIMLILLTIMISIYMNKIFKSWMPFILFLTMIGGLMIIFMYITSLINNEIFMFNFKNMMNMSLKLFLILILILILKNYLINSINLNWNNIESWNINLLLEKKNELILSNLFFNKKNSMLFIMNYLFFSMICIMNICYKFKIPLRQLIHYE